MPARFTQTGAEKVQTMQIFNIVQTDHCFHGKLDLVVSTKLANAAY
ncbi:hypothetical protein [Novosphingobium sp.]